MEAMSRYCWVYSTHVMPGMYIVLLHQVINSAIKRFFGKVKSYYSLIIKLGWYRLLLIQFNPISIYRSDSILIRYILILVYISLDCILTLITYKKDLIFVIHLRRQNVIFYPTLKNFCTKNISVKD